MRREFLVAVSLLVRETASGIREVVSGLMTLTSYLPTIFIVHPKERRKKCTVEPLRGRDGFHFHKYPHRPTMPLENYVRIGYGGPLLSADDRESGLLLLDGTWRWAEQMEPDYSELPVRSLPDWVTAYPRVSKTYDNPQAGLATIEAVYVAYSILGRETDGLLDEYYWADEFLRLNEQPVIRPKAQPTDC